MRIFNKDFFIGVGAGVVVTIFVLYCSLCTICSLGGFREGIYFPARRRRIKEK
jgi:hypothetical protein